LSIKLTKSKIFLFLCLSFILGVAVASFISIPRLLVGIFLIIAIIIIILFYGRGREAVVFGFCIIFAVAGIWQFQKKNEIYEKTIKLLNEKGRVVLEGIIDEEPDDRPENQRIVVEVDKIAGFGEMARGKVLVVINKYPKYEYGDRLEIAGYLKSPENFLTETGAEFDYKSYLAKDGIYSIIYYPETKLIEKGLGNPVKNFLYKIKSALGKGLSRVLPEPQASLAKGLILGERATIPKKLTDIFNVVGLTHIIALSGFNITIIAEAIRKVFNWLMVRRNFSFWLTIGFIIAFVLMTGASASIVRAGIMGILIVLARKEGRLYDIRNALIFAGALMMYLNPKILRFDLGFQLSFMATLGLVYISPLLEKYFQWLPKKFDLRSIGTATLSAQLAVLPLILYSFGRVSFISPFVNLLVLPFIPLAMLLGFLGGLAGIFWNFADIVFGWPAWLILSYQIKISELAAKIPLASANIEISWIWMIVMYAGLWGIIVKIQISKFKHQRKSKNHNAKILGFEI